MIVQVYTVLVTTSTTSMADRHQQQVVNDLTAPAAAAAGAPATSSSSTYISVNSTKSNFLEQTNDFIHHLHNASWIAIDEEMTGISLPPSESTRLNKEDSPDVRYHAMKGVPERYSIIQLGICLFEQASTSETETNNSSSFHVHRYKFTLFPPADPSISREVTLSPSSIHFLLQNNMNLDTWVREGIPFCTGDAATKLVEKFIDKQVELQAPPVMVPPGSRRTVVLTKEQDKLFHARVISSLREWMDAPVDTHLGGGMDGDIGGDVDEDPNGEGVSFLLPRCNSFLRRSLYEAIEREYPSLVLETQNEQIRVWRLTDEERERRKQRLLVEGYSQLIQEKIGAWRVFLALTKACTGEPIMDKFEQAILAPTAQAALEDFVPNTYLSERKIPLVVHNGLMDLLFLMTHFVSQKLPDSWAECKLLIHSHFPVIYDTKILATEYSLRDNPRSRTHLSAVYQQTIENNPEWERTFHLNNPLDEQLHDAAYDAHLTGVAFCGLSYVIQDQCKVPPVEASTRFALWDCNDDFDFPRWLYGRNKLYFHLSPYTIDLESPTSDPLGRGLSHESTFRVAEIDPSVSSRDIVTCLSGLTDSRNQLVNFDVIWVDDTTFLVGAQILDHHHDPERFKEHGKLILNALRTRFCHGETIQPLLRPVKGPTRSIWNLWGLIQFGGTGGVNGEVGGVGQQQQRPNKRRRLG